MRNALFLAAFLAGCRGATAEAAPVPPNEQKTAPKVVDAGPETPKLERFALVSGHLVDLELRTTTELEKAVPLAEASRGDRGYVVGKDEVLRAYDLPKRTLVWKAKPSHRCQLIAGARFAYCVDEGSVTAFAAKDGAPTSIPTAKHQRPALLETATSLLVFTETKLFVHDPATLAVTTTRSWTAPSLFPPPFATREGPCAASHGSVGLFVECVTDAAVTRWSHAFPTAKPGSASSWFDVTVHDGHVLAAGSFGKPKRSLVARLDGTLAAGVDEQVLAPVVVKGNLDGLVVRAPKGIALTDPAGKARWVTPIATYGESGRALVVGETLVLAIFHTGSSGCQLVGFERATGKLVWTGDVLQLPIAHSAYSNDVHLTLRDGGVVRLSGHEAGVRYEQLFDATTGKRLFAEARMRW